MYSLFKPNSEIDETVATTKRRSFFAIGLTFLLFYYISTMISGFILAIPMYYIAFTNDRFIEYIAESDELVNSPDAMTDLADGAQKVLLEIFEENASFINLCSLFATIATIGVVIFYCTKIEKRRLFTLGFSRQGALSEYLIGLGVGLLMIGTVYAIMLITGEARFVEFNHDVSYGTLLIFLLGFIIQGASEEILLRGYFFITTASNTNVLVAIISSSALFGALHIANSGFTLLAFLNLLLFGIFAAMYFLRRGSIWGICAVHAIWNFAQGNIFGCNVSGMPLDDSLLITETNNGLWSGGEFGPEGGLAVTLIFLIGIAVLTLMENKTIYNFFSRKGKFVSEPIY